MFKHVFFLLFLYGIKSSSSSSSIPQEQAVESKNVGIKKNEIGANGLHANWEIVTRNFQNPVLEYLLRENAERTKGPPERGVRREIRHSQTLLLPNFLGSHLTGVFVNQLPQFGSQSKPTKEVTGNPEQTPLDGFWNFLKNKTSSGGGKVQESVVSSPVLHLNKTQEEGKVEDSTKIQTYPAVAVVINTFDKDGSLKSSVTHFQPDFNFFMNLNGATHVPGGNKNHKHGNSDQEGAGSFMKGGGPRPQESRQGISWPFANYFPIVINDPFMSFYNAFASSMYNAVTSMVEYGPEADICAKEKSETPPLEKNSHYRTETTQATESNIFDEITMRSESFRRPDKRFGRMRRDATSIYVKSREGDTVAVTLEEPTGSNDAAVNTPEERARSFSPVLVNTPPLSTILRPPQQEPRQFLGYADKRKKTKPSKPIKEEGNSEEVGEEHEEESTGQSQESANEAVAISPPPEGASVAEAKPIGLAIAGPGGVAASKPQGTAVAGPGGLAIARPVGTAIAGVEVEGSVPIGGQQKNKKKPKQEQEQTDTELHYVGGLTGPIGNPQPKEFADSIYYKTVKEAEGNNVQENLLFRGTPVANGFQLKLGQQNGKYGFVPMFASPAERGGLSQKRMDFPIFFHGLLGNNGQGFDQFQNFHGQF